MNETEKIKHIFNIEDKNKPIVMRCFQERTMLDKEIEDLEIPIEPIWLRVVINLIRFYQKNISNLLGNRCVFDPSCSHYSELAFRKKGFFVGIFLTIRRLYRCRPNNGGVDKLI